ncbi:hypothetical protein Tco_1166020 [Tanacetum coccineum]
MNILISDEDKEKATRKSKGAMNLPLILLGERLQHRKIARVIHVQSLPYPSPLILLQLECNVTKAQTRRRESKGKGEERGHSYPTGAYLASSSGVWGGVCGGPGCGILLGVRASARGWGIGRRCERHVGVWNRGVDSTRENCGEETAGMVDESVECVAYMVSYVVSLDLLWEY